MESLYHAYDMAQDGEQGNGWIAYCGAMLGVAAEEDAQVRVWDTSDVDTEETFDTDELTMKQFMKKVEIFAHDHATAQVGR
jgi:hypothetical protein